MQLLGEVELARRRTGWSLNKILGLFEISSSQYHRWQRERYLPSDKLLKPYTQLLPEEVDSVLYYRKLNEHNRMMGYRKFTWKLVDENLVYLSESSVYRILKRHKLLGRVFKESLDSDTEYNKKPQYVHHHWHTDLMYLRLCGSHYYIVFMLDGYSRYLLNYKLLTDMTKQSVELFTQETIDKYPEASPMIIHDNGVQFISRDFKEILYENDCIDIPTKVRHPETNGKAERFVRTMRDESLRVNSPQYYSEAQRVIDKFVEEYNNRRYHAAIGYLKPVDVFMGIGEEVIAERKAKLKKAREKRIAVNKEKRREFAGVC